MATRDSTEGWTRSRLFPFVRGFTNLRSCLHCCKDYVSLPSRNTQLSYLFAVPFHRNHVPRLLKRLLDLFGRSGFCLGEQNTRVEQPRSLLLIIIVLLGQEFTGHVLQTEFGAGV